MCSFGCGLGTPSIGSSAHSRPCPADGVDAIEKAKWAAPVPPPARLTSGKEIAPVQGLSTTHRIPESFKRDSDHSAWFGPGRSRGGISRARPRRLWSCNSSPGYHPARLRMTKALKFTHSGLSTPCMLGMALVPMLSSLVPRKTSPIPTSWVRR